MVEFLTMSACNLLKTPLFVKERTWWTWYTPILAGAHTPACTRRRVSVIKDAALRVTMSTISEINATLVKGVGYEADMVRMS
jgi:hypothetical protein